MIGAKMFLDVEFCRKPLTFIEVPGYQMIWDSPDRFLKGVYLWCIDFESGFLINYVGKTFGRRGFEGRLWKELSDWRKGRYWTAIDVSQFPLGRREPIQNPDANHLKKELEELQWRYRLFLAPLSSDADCVQVESHIVDQLRGNPFTFQFLGNRDKHKKYRPNPSIGVRFAELPNIVGLAK